MVLCLFYFNLLFFCFYSFFLFLSLLFFMFMPHTITNNVAYLLNTFSFRLENLHITPATSGTTPLNSTTLFHARPMCALVKAFIQKIVVSVSVLNSYACLRDTAVELYVSRLRNQQVCCGSTFKNSALINLVRCYIHQSRSACEVLLRSNFKTFQKSRLQKHASG